MSQPWEDFQSAPAVTDEPNHPAKDFQQGQAVITSTPWQDFQQPSASSVPFYNRTTPEAGDFGEGQTGKADSALQIIPTNPLHTLGEGLAGFANIPAGIHNVIYPNEQYAMPFSADKPLLPPGLAQAMVHSVVQEFTPGNPETGTDQEQPTFRTGVEKAVGEGLSGLTTPEMVAALPLAGAGGTVGKLTQLGFGAQMAESTPKAVYNAVQTVKNPKATGEQKGEAVAQGVLDSVMTGLIALGHTPDEAAKYTPQELQAIGSSTTSPRVFNLPDKQFDLSQVAQQVANPSAPKLTPNQIQFLGTLAQTDPVRHKQYLTQVADLRTQQTLPTAQSQSVTPTEPETFLSSSYSGGGLDLKPLNPGGAESSLSPDLQAKSKAASDAQRQAFAEWQAGQKQAVGATEAGISKPQGSLIEPQGMAGGGEHSLSAPANISGVKGETYQGGKAVTYTDNGRIRLVNIETDVAERGKGYAGKFLQDLKQRGLPIELDVANDTLKPFYKKQGFVQGQRPSTMVWSPDLEKKNSVKEVTLSEPKTQEEKEVRVGVGAQQEKPLRTKEENVSKYGEGRGFVTQTEKELYEKKPFGIQKNKDGGVSTSTLLSKLKSTSKEERQLLDDAGLTDFLKGKETVKPEEVAKWVKENGPRVEVRKMGEGSEIPEQKELRQLEHGWYDTLQRSQKNDFHNFNAVMSNDLNKLSNWRMEDINKAVRYKELLLNEHNFPKSQKAHWSNVSPKSESEMKGYVEIAVTKPIAPASEGSGKVTQSIKFPSSHSFPLNTLAWVRGHMETTKDGRKVFLIHEVQSDWARQARDDGHRVNETNDQWEERNNRQNKEPLLNHYESLALKAAIEHARSEGADAVAVSDAETAMMTEGHDRNRQSSPEHVPMLPQEKGMRQHYDQSLPNIAKKLTGVEGVREELGEHKMAFDTDTAYNDRSLKLDEVKRTPRKDLIFRNPDGTPKTSITARVYPLSKVAERLDTKEPMQMTGSRLFITADPFGLAKFAKQDILPALKKGADVVTATRKLLTSLISPTSLAEVKNVDTMFEGKGYAERFMVKATHAVDDIVKGFEKMPKQDKVDFMDRVKRGQSQPTKELQQVANVLRDIDNSVYTEALKYKPSLPFKENHLRAIWEVIPGSQSKGLTKQNIGSKRPWEGSQGWSKKSTLVDISEGLAKGGKLVTDNPAKLVLLNAQDNMKFIAANRSWEGLKKTGTVQYVKQGKRAPMGYVRLDDGIARVYFPTTQGMVKGGEYWVESNTARLINNYLSRDLIRESQVGKAAMDVKMASTAVELGLSPFHAIFEANETVSSSLGLALSKGLSGRVREGVEGLAKSVTDIVSTPKLGGMVKRYAESEADFKAQDPEGYAWFVKQYPNAQQMVVDGFNSGMKLTIHDDYKTKFREGFVNAVKEGNALGATMRAIPALNEFPMDALFNKYVPRLKMGMFFREYAFELERRSSDLASGKITRGELGRQTWDFVEDRFGEMNFDDLYWNRTVKSSLQLLMRSITWRLGTARAYAKALRDTGLELGVNWWKEDRTPRMTLPMAWLVGQAVWGGVLASGITYASTGKWPWQLSKNEDELARNLTFPRIDEHDKSQRVSMPTYWKDAASMWHSPGGYVAGGLTGELNRIYEAYENKDFYGVQVYNPEDPVQVKVKDFIEHLAPVPFGVANLQKSGTTEQKTLGFMGFPKAPAYESQSPAEQLAGELLKAKSPQGARSKEQYVKQEEEKQTIDKIRSGAETLQDAMKQGQIDKKRESTVKKKLKDTYLQYAVEKLGVDDSMKLYEQADDEERTSIKQLIHKKIVGPSSTLKLIERQTLLKELEHPTGKVPKKDTKTNRYSAFDDPNIS